jgi:hypothetical protein
MLLAITAPSAVPAALAQDEDELDLEIQFENDELPAAVHPLTPSLFYGAELELISKLNYDLDRKDDEDEIRLEPFLKLRLAHIPAQHFEAVVSFELAREFLIERPPDEPTPPTRLDLTEACVTFRVARRWPLAQTWPAELR